MSVTFVCSDISVTIKDPDNKLPIMCKEDNKCNLALKSSYFGSCQRVISTLINKMSFHSPHGTEVIWV